MDKPISITPRFDMAMAYVELKAEKDIREFMARLEMELWCKVQLEKILDIHRETNMLLYDAEPKLRWVPLMDQETLDMYYLQREMYFMDPMKAFVDPRNPL